MKSILFASLIFGLLSNSNAATATKKFSGAQAKALYTALIQSNLPAKETSDGYTIVVQNLRCSIETGNAFIDGVDRGTCSALPKKIGVSAAAVAVATALIDIGLDGEGMSQLRPAASAISCKSESSQGPTEFSCSVTADF